LWLANHGAAAPGQALIDAGGPLRVGVAGGGALLLSLADAATGTRAALLMDAYCAARLAGAGGGAHYAAATVDAAARVLTWSEDGVVCDGGAEAMWGWEWAPEGMGGRVLGGAQYLRALVHTKAEGNWRAGRPREIKSAHFIRQPGYLLRRENAFFSVHLIVITAQVRAIAFGRWH
jgi:hypothetical protein